MLAALRSPAVALLGLLLTAGDLPAAVLELANGDRLQGRLIARENGTIRWESPILGTVTVPATQATIVDGAGPPATPAATPQRTEKSRPPSAASSPTAGSATTTPETSRWKTTIESGLSLQTGRSDRADLDLRVETTLQRRRNAFRALARYRYAKADGSVTTDRTEAAFRWRRELDQHWFGQSNTSYLSARVKGIDHNLEQNVGLGYRILKTERTTASLGAGLTGQYRQIADADTGHSLFGEAFQDFTFKISPRLDCGQDFTIQYSPSGRGIRILPGGQVQIIDTDVMNYKFALNAFLRGKLSDTLSLALRYEYEFDNTYVTGSAKAEQRITTTLGCSF